MIEVIFELGPGTPGFHDGKFVIYEGCSFYDLLPLFKDGYEIANDDPLCLAVARLTCPVRNKTKLRLFLDDDESGLSSIKHDNPTVQRAWEQYLIVHRLAATQRMTERR